MGRYKGMSSKGSLNVEDLVELVDIYEKHIHDQSERRFIVDHQGQNVGLVELVEIDYIHRRAEFQIIIDPAWQNHGFATAAAKLAMAYAFDALNLYKLYLVVDNENVRAIHVYSKLGFQAEGVLIHEFFANGAYHDATRMCIFQHEYRSLYGSDSGPAAALPGDGPGVCLLDRLFRRNTLLWRHDYLRGRYCRKCRIQHFAVSYI